MLPNFHSQRYQEFAQALEQMQQTISAANNLDKSKLNRDVLKLQQFFQQQILSLEVEESRIRSYQTEVNKQLRLLSMDIQFLQAARQSQTVEERIKQIFDRLQTLIGYCNAIVQFTVDG